MRTSPPAFTITTRPKVGPGWFLIDPTTKQPTTPQGMSLRLAKSALRKLLKGPQIKETYHDDDGWWVILRDGWTIDGCVGWREDTKARLFRRIKDAKYTGQE